MSATLSSTRRGNACLRPGCRGTAALDCKYCSRACRDDERSRLGWLTVALDRARERERRRRAFGIPDDRRLNERIAERLKWAAWERERHRVADRFGAARDSARRSA